MSDPITLHRIQQLHPGSSRLLTSAMIGVVGTGLNLPTRRVRFEVVDWQRIEAGPALIVGNHTHWIDWIALRWVAYWRGRALCNWTKPRTYEEGYARFLDLTGNLPVVSRGYLLSADIRALTGRAPSELEYRALHEHLDSGAALPRDPLFERVQAQPRDILGVAFEPQRHSYRECLEGLFFAMMQATLAHTKTLCERGVDLQIMPQGVTSMRLTKGHPGALQAALALGLPVVPVGISGFPQAFGKGRTLPAHGGVVTVRVGEPYRASPIKGHTPFLPSSERTHAVALSAGTQQMMDRIASLVDPEHGPADSEDQADVTGVARFV